MDKQTERRRRSRIALPADTQAQLESLAEARNTTPNTIIRLAVMKYIAEQEARQC